MVRHQVAAFLNVTINSNASNTPKHIINHLATYS